MGDMDDKETILALLEEKAAYHKGELERYRSAIYALGGSASVQRQDTVTTPEPPVRVNDGRVALMRRRKVDNPMASTQAMIERVLADSPALGYKQLTEKMLEAGWITESVTPSNTVRTALGRLSERGIVERTEDGLFRVPASTEEAQ